MTNFRDALKALKCRKMSNQSLLIFQVNPNINRACSSLFKSVPAQPKLVLFIPQTFNMLLLCNMWSTWSIIFQASWITNIPKPSRFRDFRPEEALYIHICFQWFIGQSPESVKFLWKHVCTKKLTKSYRNFGSQYFSGIKEVETQEYKFIANVSEAWKNIVTQSFYIF